MLASNDFSGFPSNSAVKNPPASARDVSSLPGSGRSPGEGNGKPTPVFLSGKSHEQRSMWATVHGVAKELDRT